MKPNYAFLKKLSELENVLIVGLVNSPVVIWSSIDALAVGGVLHFDSLRMKYVYYEEHLRMRDVFNSYMASLNFLGPVPPKDERLNELLFARRELTNMEMGCDSYCSKENDPPPDLLKTGNSYGQVRNVTQE